MKNRQGSQDSLGPNLDMKALSEQDEQYGQPKISTELTCPTIS